MALVTMHRSQISPAELLTSLLMNARSVCFHTSLSVCLSVCLSFSVSFTARHVDCRTPSHCHKLLRLGYDFMQLTVWLNPAVFNLRPWLGEGGTREMHARSFLEMPCSLQHYIRRQGATTWQKFGCTAFSSTYPDSHSQLVALYV